MGEVCQAEDLRLGRRVTLKFLSDVLTDDSQAPERFQRKARAASSLDHPNICTIYEIGEFERRAYIAMQMLEGQTLRERVIRLSKGNGRNPSHQRADRLEPGLATKRGGIASFAN